MAEANWYVVHTYSGYENKVKVDIEKSVENRNLQDQILEVSVPTQPVTELKNNVEKTIERKMFPGYVLIRMIMNDETWYVVRNTRGVTGFVGPGSKPVPLSEEEMRKLGFGGGEQPAVREVVLDFALGDTVTVVSGPWKDAVGKVAAINEKKRTVTLPIDMFGRETPVVVVMLLSNGVNLTDGVDGLASGSSAIVGVVLGVFAYVSSHHDMAGYLNTMFIPGAEELVIFAATLVGATAGFLWYNSYPAQVFMGDTGSLALGGIIGVFAILIRKELLLPILCGIFIAEFTSSFIQRFYFKYTRMRTGKGVRVFKMAPLHHHFQLPGGAATDSILKRPIAKIPEAKLTMRFWLIGILLAVVTIVTLKIR